MYGIVTRGLLSVNDLKIAFTVKLVMLTVTVVGRVLGVGVTVTFALVRPETTGVVPAVVLP